MSQKNDPVDKLKKGAPRIAFFGTIIGAVLLQMAGYRYPLDSIERSILLTISSVILAAFFLVIFINPSVVFTRVTRTDTRTKKSLRERTKEEQDTDRRKLFWRMLTAFGIYTCVMEIMKIWNK